DVAPAAASGWRPGLLPDPAPVGELPVRRHRDDRRVYRPRRADLGSAAGLAIRDVAVHAWAPGPVRRGGTVWTIGADLRRDRAHRPAGGPQLARQVRR